MALVHAMAHISVAGSLVGIPSWVSAPVAGVLISLVVVLGSFHRVEHVLLVVSSTLALHIVDGLLAGPDWSMVLSGSLIPRMPLNAAGWVTVAAVSVVWLPGLPLVPLIYSSQVVNAVLLPLHVVALQVLAASPAIMGDAYSAPRERSAGWISIALIVACDGALAWSWLAG